MAFFPTGHTSSQKSKIRTRARSGMNKAKETGEICNTFIAYVYWDFDRGSLEGSGHLPEGMDLPDINKLVSVGSGPASYKHVSLTNASSGTFSSRKLSGNTQMTDHRDAYYGQPLKLKIKSSLSLAKMTSPAIAMPSHRTTRSATLTQSIFSNAMIT